MTSMPCTTGVGKSKGRLVFFARALILLTGALVGLLSARVALAQQTWFVDDSQNDGLVAHWRFDEALSSATFTREFVGASHGTLSATGGLVSSPTSPVQLPNNGVFYANGTRYITVTLTSAIQLATEFTFAAWIRRDANSTEDEFQALYDSGQQDNEWWIYIDDSNRLGFARRPSPHFTSAGTITADGNYHHVAVVKTATGVSFYIDGIFIETESVVGTTFNIPSGSPHIGALVEDALLSTTVFDGHLDDTRLYNRALTAPEIARLAQGRGCVTTGTTWAAAFRELQCALHIGLSSPGDDVLIAKGIYYPGTNRLANFNVEDGLHLYGGYNNGDPALPRPVPDFTAAPANLTILSGDLNRNDDLFVPRFDSSYTGNTNRVVHLSAGNSTHIQGLQIRGGNAITASGFDQGGGMKAHTGSTATLVNVSFLANSANALGGALYSEGTLAITNTQFISNTSVNLNGGAIASFALLQITFSHFERNHGSFNGGAIDVAGPTTIDASTFLSNTAQIFYGGAIHTSSLLTVTQSSFSHNSAGFGGGAIGSQFGAPSVRIDDTDFFSNRTNTFSGGAVYTLNGDLNVTNSIFERNNANSQGGALALENGNLQVTDSTFENNSARSQGGAISVISAPTQTITIRDTDLRLNQVTGINCVPGPCSHANGGAIGARGNIIIQDSTIISNSATLLGGGLFVSSGSRSIVQDVTFSNNVSGNAFFPGDPNIGDGGAIASQGVITVTDSLLSNNSTGGEGGAIYLIEGAPLQLDRATLVSNSAASGGGISATAPLDSTLGVNVNIATSHFESNHATQFGGAIQSSTISEITASTFFSNTAAVEGGAFVSFAPTTIRSSQFVANLSSLSGAFAVDDPVGGAPIIVLENSLFAHNRATADFNVAAVARLFDASLQARHNTFISSITTAPQFKFIRSLGGFQNNIFVSQGGDFNLSTGGPDASLATEDFNLYFPAAPPADSGLTQGASSAVGDPLFADFAGDNFHLSAASPARNTGANLGITTDFEGDTRPIGGAPDRGYDEARFVPPLVAPPANDVATQNQTKTFGLGSFADGDADGAFQVTVNWGDGTPNTLLSVNASGAIPPQAHIYTTPGAKTVTITVTDAAGQSHAVTFTITVTDAPATATPVTLTSTATATQPAGGATPTSTPTLQPNVQYLPAITKP